MRTMLGRIAALCFAGTALFVGTSSAIEVRAVAETTTTVETTTTSTTPTTTTTTTFPPPLVIDVPSPPAPVLATPSRGEQVQVTETLPPPPTTTLPPEDQLPADSGEGRRVVYSKSLMRVWAVESSGEVSKTHRVSGRRTYNQPSPGTYSVFSRSAFTCNIKNPAICWRFMVRFTVGPDGDNIGLHEIPKKDGVPVQSESQLGQALSGGCVRQATPDAIYMWDWAPVGTKVVVLP
jgi:hypothetical protein